MTKKVWYFTGGKGSGKSTAVAYYARPSEISKAVVIDNEDSMSDILENLERKGLSFGHYARAYERLGSTEDRQKMISRIARGDLPWIDSAQRSMLVKYWEWYVKTLDKIFSSGNYKYLVIDSTEPLEGAAAAWAEANPSKSSWAQRKRKFGKNEVEAIRPLIEYTLEAVHQCGVSDILLTAHLKTPWLEDSKGNTRPILDKVVPGGRTKIWRRVTTGMFWLVRPARPANPVGAPSAIILKARRGDLDVDAKNDEWDTTSLIPPRIPMFTWREWHRYEREGWNPLNPKEGELLYPDEQKMISELLSDAQMELMILGTQLAIEEQRNNNRSFGLVSHTSKTFSTDELTSEQIEQIKSLKAEGKTPRSIAKSLGISIRKVKGALKQ